ncbi:YbaN family protein [Candidatus Stoquefichus massiliensis]|uniref:YbaN family protein n=1 Tax=Candidatus Stoquefichus massiliensis TaxID=1470350 RepID=UPI00048484F3|nr:YbaN family protein [Candidatus Stoquefichus massiliensis]
MKSIYFILGMVCFALGAIGVILPILPTTPFLLACAFCFARSSSRVNNWFLSTQLYKNHLDSFVQQRAMTLKTKICILTFASIMLAFPLIFSSNIYIRIMIVCLYLIKYYYFIFRIKTISKPVQSI